MEIRGTGSRTDSRIISWIFLVNGHSVFYTAERSPSEIMWFLRNGEFKTMGLVVATKGEYSEKFNTRNNKIEYSICGTC